MAEPIRIIPPHLWNAVDLHCHGNRKPERSVNVLATVVLELCPFFGVIATYYRPHELDRKIRRLQVTLLFDSFGH